MDNEVVDEHKRPLRTEQGLASNIRTLAGEQKRSHQRNGLKDRDNQQPYVNTGLMVSRFDLVGSDPQLFGSNSKLLSRTLDLLLSDPSYFLLKSIYALACMLIAGYGFSLLIDGRTWLGAGLVLSGWIALTLGAALSLRV
ncbi:MAG: hypothetical protein ACYDAB_02105 [bacterium]